MRGIYSLSGAVVAGMLMKLLPAILDSLNLPADVLTILFGIGVLQVLLSAPGGLAAQAPTGRRAPVGRDRRPEQAGRAGGGARALIEIEDLTVRFGGVDAARRHDRALRHGHVRPDRAQRGGQDDLLQRPEWFRRAGLGPRARLRRGPGRDAALPSRSLGPARAVRCG
jgi:hypothetical protein